MITDRRAGCAASDQGRYAGAEQGGDNPNNFALTVRTNDDPEIPAPPLPGVAATYLPGDIAGVGLPGVRIARSVPPSRIRFMPA